MSDRTTLADALARHRNGELEEAERLYRRILQTDDKNPEVIALLGTLRAQSGDFQEAIDLLQRSLKLDRRQPFALNSLGNALNSLNRYTEALAAFDKAIVLKEDHAAAYNNRGTALRGLGRPNDALATIDRAIGLNPQYPEAFNNRGLALRDLGRPEDALKSHERAIALRAAFPDAHKNLGDQLRALKRYDAALASYDSALVLEPGSSELHGSRGNVLRELKRYDEALQSFEQALARTPLSAVLHFNKGLTLQELERDQDALASYDRAIAQKPDFAGAHNNRGNVLAKLGRHLEALESYDASIRLDPKAQEVHGNRGTLLRALRRPADALVSFDRALALNPNHAETHNLRGLVLQDLRRLGEAVQAYDKAIALRPDYASAHHHRAIALKDLQRFDEALASIEKAIALDADIPYALGERLVIKMHSCDWNGLQAACDAVVEAVGKGARASTPFVLLAVPCEDDIRRACAEIFMRDQHPPRSATPPSARRSDPGDKIRIAYVSGDFRAHAVGFLVADMLERHDRSRFEVHAISFGRDDKSPARARLEKAVDRFADVRATADGDAASLMRERNIDIAIDLMGFTGSCRTGIFAHRPAPIQVNYLGYPGTMGAGYIDYIVADRIVVPDDEQRFYAEKIVHLPDTYQCNDSKRRVEDTALSRTDAGLPEEGFVFCSFNNNYKIGPQIFGVWMRILERTPDSVLWLLRSNADAERNLRREAETRGIAGERLIFAPRVPLADHLARHRLADLFLDTHPYGAHTTASDALCAGLPVLTLLGNSFAGRVAASLLNAIGLPELITRSLAEYEHAAVTFADDRAALAAIKSTLERNRDTHPLFDTARFTRSLEAAYARMVERCRRGEPPAAFAVNGV